MKMLGAGPPRELSQQISDDSSNVIILPYCGFTMWWIIIFSVHLATCIYNALYAYCYWKLKGTSLNLYLEFYQIGMPQSYHPTIAVIFALMSAVHGVCILLILGGSIWKCSLTFTPWSCCKVGITSDERNSGSRLRLLVQMYDKFTYPCGLFGVKGKYFEFALVCREIVETSLQTVQAYRMSALLPRTILNRFYVIMLVINCWSSVIVDTAFYKHDEARRRFACIFFDCLLDLMACMGVELIVLLSYVGDYDCGTKGFNAFIWYNDEWVGRALNEFQIVFVVSWSDLVIRTTFSLGLVITTTSMKKLLRHLPQNGNRIAQSDTTRVVAVCRTHQKELLGASANLIPVEALHVHVPYPKQTRLNLSGQPVFQVRKLCSQRKNMLLQVAHLLFVVWGAVVLGFHIHASLQPTLPQCLMQVRPWAASEPSCYLAGLDCHTLGIPGKLQEVESMWSEFDSSTVIQLLIRHCPALEIPDSFAEFHRLRGIKVYNTIIVDWGEAAAITNTNHPKMTYIYIVRVNMTDGLLPSGFQSLDFPQNMNDIELCVTNLRELPEDLDSKWPPGAIIQVEYSQLTTLPLALTRLEPLYLFLTGNSIIELPPEVFEVDGMIYLGISDMNIHELPRNVTRVSPSLNMVEIGNTNISFFWSWVDDLVGRTDNPAYFVAESSKYCDDLEKTNKSFRAPLSSEYSNILMNSSEANWNTIARAVDCSSFDEEPFYPLAYEDGINAVSTPPALERQP